MASKQPYNVQSTIAGVIKSSAQRATCRVLGVSKVNKQGSYAKGIKLTKGRLSSQAS